MRFLWIAILLVTPALAHANRLPARMAGREARIERQTARREAMAARRERLQYRLELRREVLRGLRGTHRLAQPDTAGMKRIL